MPHPLDLYGRVLREMQGSAAALVDHALSCDPDDLARLVALAPRVRASLGAGDKARQPSEAATLEATRKGVVAARDLEAGTVLAGDDLMFARPASEFPASEIDSLPGARLRAGVKKGELIRRADVDFG